jgi:hypothetical protein
MQIKEKIIPLKVSLLILLIIAHQQTVSGLLFFSSHVWNLHVSIHEHLYEVITILYKL